MPSTRVNTCRLKQRLPEGCPMPRRSLGPSPYAMRHQHRSRLPHHCVGVALFAFLSADGGGVLTSLTLPTYRSPGGVLVTVMAHSVQHSINKRLLIGSAADQSPSQCRRGLRPKYSRRIGAGELSWHVPHPLSTLFGKAKLVNEQRGRNGGQAYGGRGNIHLSRSRPGHYTRTRTRAHAHKPRTKHDTSLRTYHWVPE